MMSTLVALLTNNSNEKRVLCAIKPYRFLLTIKNLLMNTYLVSGVHIHIVNEKNRTKETASDTIN